MDIETQILDRTSEWSEKYSLDSQSGREYPPLHEELGMDSTEYESYLHSKAVVTLDIYSGRRNPTLVFDSMDLNRIFNLLTKINTKLVESEYAYLGYRGFKLWGVYVPSRLLDHKALSQEELSFLYDAHVEVLNIFNDELGIPVSSTLQDLKEYYESK